MDPIHDSSKAVWYVCSILSQAQAVALRPQLSPRWCEELGPEH